ncbi:hypothetical protein E2C01_067493 [Portunus trituberculatus]|uniref:Uncharacterized protein n=1 Tax=Portunus trituberculatus TaxID=210409 RepID=A0A5B7HTS1_PORTR|nr:hypothetical protein [Portunus trituberculatus]
MYGTGHFQACENCKLPSVVRKRRKKTSPVPSLVPAGTFLCGGVGVVQAAWYYCRYAHQSQIIPSRKPKLRQAMHAHSSLSRSNLRSHPSLLAACGLLQSLVRQVRNLLL